MQAFAVVRQQIGLPGVLVIGAPPSGTSAPTIFLRGSVNASPFQLFRSTNNGTTFTRINDDLHQWAVGARVLVGDMRTFGVVYIGTDGRGIMRGSPALG